MQLNPNQSVGLSDFVGTSRYFFCGVWSHCSCPNAQVASNTAPAYPHVTWVAMYLALLSREVAVKWEGGTVSQIKDP